MISQLQLSNFKCFDSAKIGLSALTLLAGINGAGKSTVIQSLMVLRQSLRKGSLSEGKLSLAGNLVDLGRGEDVLFADARADRLSIGLKWSDGYEFNFDVDYDKDAEELGCLPLEQDSWHTFSAGEAQNRTPFNEDVQYINAERLGPRKSLTLPSEDAKRFDVGVHGENVFHVLSTNRDVSLSADDTRLVEGSSKALHDQVEAWLKRISPQTRLEINLVQAADIAYAGYAFERPGDVATKSFRSTNVGFGLSYTLPIITALLISGSGSLVVIENPEAHVHPAGQTMLGELAAKAASAGVQVIVETHSDHFLNGIRIAVREQTLDPKDASIHFFEREGIVTSVHSPKIDNDGRLSEWPAGFFDQYEQSLIRLL